MVVDATRVRSLAPPSVANQSDQSSPDRRLGQVDRPRVSISTVVMIGVGVLALMAPALAPYDPHLSVAAPLVAPGPAHWLGTNDIGQDVLSQWLYAARPTIGIALTVTGLATLLAWSAGLLSGMSARAETPIVALIDLLLALPPLPLFMLVLTLIGPSQANVALMLGLLAWPAFARVVRAQVIATREAPFVEAARGLGASSLHVARTHILPVTLAIFPAHLVLTLRFAVFAEATLAFLGLGDPSAPSWGGMLGWAVANPLLFTSPAWTWLVLPPALGIAVLLLVGGLSAWAPHHRPSGKFLSSWRVWMDGSNSETVGAAIVLEGEYVPSPRQWVRDQVAAYEHSAGEQANTLRDTGLPVIIVTMRGNKTGQIRKIALMRVAHNGEYALVASMGGAPKNPVWYYNLQANPDAVIIQDGAEPFEAQVREVSGDERAVWWERSVAAYPPYAEYQLRTTRQIPVLIARRKG